ncbi:SDR family oxidoreductase [Bradyrhizobium sp. LHD-71]|uniref:SDR family oxidoreductase n=1 Tax=Bradyrhizobium sp. LHD-71 TaxID=3072141 RepID=UPI00280DDA73|nr:SDR family oxidoreductase [Bradyrhizobium sp. LHD-71]MDQ8727291.1 SDR family oxidoreductase [Bradyrhizobium sp. LHD-71]
MSALANKVALVTGASSGIGRAAAKLFAQEGASVIVAARRRVELDRLTDEIDAAGGRAVALAGDVADEAFAKALVDLAQDRFGGLDVAFNNAGTTGELGDITTMSRENWSRTLDVNLTSAFLGAKQQIPAMLKRGGGSLIFTSTFVGYTAGFPGTVAYAASKSGLIGMTQVLASELGPKHIRVNALLPGGTDTPMAREMSSTAEAWSFVEGLHALKRVASPDEIARSALYLASDASSFVTGTALLVDGGVSINKA